MQTPLLFTSAKTALASPQKEEPALIFPFKSARSALSPAAATTAQQAAPTYTHSFALTVRGLIHHRETGALAALLTQQHTDSLCLAREDNGFDENAVAVHVVDGQGERLKLGYVGKEEAAVLAPFVDSGVAIERVTALLSTPPPAVAVAVKQEEEGGDAQPMDVDVVIKPDPDAQPAPLAPPAQPSSSSAPIPTSLTLHVHARTDQEGTALALQQAFPPPPPSPSLLAALEEERAAAERQRLLGVLAAACAKVERESRAGLRVLSLFDGIGAALVTLLKERCPVALYCSAEVDSVALAVMEGHWPAFAPDGNDGGNDKQEQQQPPPIHVPLGDVRLIDARLVALLQPDLIIGGSPCQDLSRLNRRGKGLEGPESRLFFEYIRVLELCKATEKGRRGELVAVLENVVPREEAQHEAMNRHMQLSAVRLNASEVSAASRDRLYWTNLPVHGLRPSPEEEAAELSDVLVSGRPAYSLPGNLNSNGKACCIIRSVHRDWNLIDDPTHPAAIAAGSRYRPLVPIEEERLLGFPDHYTRAGGLTDDRRHALLGNSFSVPVVRQILRRLKPLAEARTKEERGVAVKEMRLLAFGSPVAIRWCSNCGSRVCVCI